MLSDNIWLWIRRLLITSILSPTTPLSKMQWTWIRLLEELKQRSDRSLKLQL